MPITTNDSSIISFKSCSYNPVIQAYILNTFFVFEAKTCNKGLNFFVKNGNFSVYGLL